MSPTYFHLDADSYPAAFPVSIDTVPVLLQKKTYIDAWLFNRMSSMIQAVQQFVLDNKTRLEA